MALRVAVLGFGFSGLMVTAHLVRQVPEGSILYVIGDSLSGRGMAYGTQAAEHVLNVPAGRMGAEPDALEGFLQWLHSAEGALAKQHRGITTDYAAADFVPRALYGDYLETQWQQVQEQASARGVLLKLVETQASAIRTEDGLAVLTARGDAIAVDKVILAVGNEAKQLYPGLRAAQFVQQPWQVEWLEGAADFASPVLLIGAGLTAVDTVMSLRARGYTGEIVVTSRSGRWPLPHAGVQPYLFNREELFAQQGLRQLLRYVRAAITAHDDWRGVIDGLRPHTQALWQTLSLRDQQRFLNRLLSVWNIHRHRMAPEIAAQLAQEMEAGTLRVVAGAMPELAEEDGVLHAMLRSKSGVETLMPSRVVNCTGSELRVAKSRNPLLVQLLGENVAEPHATGLGLAVDVHHRAWGSAHPHLYVVGTWMTGQLLESTAVPELRVQAKAVADHIAATWQ